MPLPAELARLAGLHRARQQLLARRTTQDALRRWGLVDAGNLIASWGVVLPVLLDLVTTAQIEATRGVDDYVAAAVAAQGGTPRPAGRVPDRALAGVASDGRPLESLLDWPMRHVEALVSGGTPTAEALGIGLRHLGRIVTTQVQDAARVATGVAIVGDRAVDRYVRVATPPSCSRCVILAGRVYRVARAFPRHPRCDCVNAPAASGVDPPSPEAMYRQMTPEQRRQAGWSVADQRAIDDGGDLYQITNARRQLRTMTVAGRPVQTTRHGATRRGLAGKRLDAPKGRAAIRITPEQIYTEAERLGWSRDETIRQLWRHGYIL